MRLLMLPFLLFVSCVSLAEGELWSQEVDTVLEGGKLFKMSFQEIERKENYSIARVEYMSGPSVGSAMFVFDGFRNIAKQAGRKFMVPLGEWKDESGNKMYKFGFADSKKVNMKQIFGPDINPEIERAGLIPVN